MAARTIYLIKRLEMEVTSRMTHKLGVQGITPAQFTILSFVDKTEMDMSSAQLSRRFFMTPQSMNEVVGTLERKELIEIDTDPNHKRILRIRLTEIGQETLQVCNIAMDSLEADLLSGFNAEETNHFRQFIGRILTPPNEGL